MWGKSPVGYLAMHSTPLAVCVCVCACVFHIHVQVYFQSLNSLTCEDITNNTQHVLFQAHMLTYHLWKFCKCDVSVWDEATHSTVQYSTVQYSTVHTV